MQIPIRLHHSLQRHCELATGRAADPPLMKPPPDRFPGERGCNPIGMSENGGEFSAVSESFRSHIPICDRYSGANFRKISAANQSNRAFSATTHGKSQLDYTLESRDPFIRLLSARRVGPGFRRGSVFTVVSYPWTILFLVGASEAISGR
jgi:hypothetical protein